MDTSSSTATAVPGAAAAPWRYALSFTTGALPAPVYASQRDGVQDPACRSRSGAGPAPGLAGAAEDRYPVPVAGTGDQPGGAVSGPRP